MLDPEIEARVRALRQGGGGDDLSHAMRDPQVAKYVEMAMRLPDTAAPTPQSQQAAPAASASQTRPPPPSGGHERWSVCEQEEKYLHHGMNRVLCPTAYHPFHPSPSWKCGRKNPLPDGTCAQCAQQLGRLPTGPPGADDERRTEQRSGTNPRQPILYSVP